MLKSLWALVAVLFIGSLPAARAQEEAVDSSETGTTVSRKHMKKRVVIDDSEETVELAEPVSTARPNALSVELLGRGFLWGVAYDRSLGEHFALGIGYSGWKTDGSYWKDEFTVVPVYTNFYFTPNRNRGFFTGGLTYLGVKSEYSGKYAVTNSDTTGFAISDANGSVSTIFGTLGGGYEFRGYSGFLFRVAAYEFIAKQSMTWLGLSLGATF